MSKYQRITLYFKLDDDQDSLRYAFIGSLGKNKKTIFEKMIDKYLQDYGISNLEDLTLKDLQNIKKELIGEEAEKKEKRPRGRPRKVVEQTVEEQPIEKVKQPSEEPKLEEEVIKKQDTTPIVSKVNPMAVNIEDDDDEDEGGVDMDLFNQIGAFM